MRYLKYLLLVIVAMFIVGCNRKEIKLEDDTWYVVDDSAILMLCEKNDDKPFKDLIVKLKGNGDSVKEAINILNNMEQDVAVKNALGVGYLRLRMFEEADMKFREALKIASSEDDKACILSNLVETMLCMEDVKSAENYVEDALKLEVNDSLKDLVLQSNIEAMKLSHETEDYIRAIANIKELIKKEKIILGSNQFLGIFNYKMLAYACYYNNNMSRCEYYMNMAKKLNLKTFQYVDVDAYLYKSLARMYDDTMEGVDKAMDYINKDIDILEKWQTPDHYDLMISHIIRGNLYANRSIPDRDSAIKDYQYVLDHCSPYNSLAATSYYGLARVYVYSENATLITESYAKAYYLWGLEDWNDLNEDIERELRAEYDRQNNGKESYDIWFKQQIKKAERDLKVKWKQ